MLRNKENWPATSGILECRKQSFWPVLHLAGNIMYLEP